MILKLGTRNLHHIRNKMTPMLLPWQHPWFQSLCVRNQISPFATFLSGTGGLPWNRHGSHICINNEQDIPKSGIPFFSTLKSLSNKQLLFLLHRHFNTMALYGVCEVGLPQCITLYQKSLLYRLGT